MSVAVVIPASGVSKRFGGADKLLAPFGRGSVVRATAAAAAGSTAVAVVVVRRTGDARIAAEVAGLDVRVVDNACADEGLAASIRAGVAALPEDIAGAAILPGDLPAMRAEVIDRLIAVFEAEERRRVVVPLAADAGARRDRLQQRNPVIWPRRYFTDLLALEGDAGAKGLLCGLAPEDVATVTFDDPVAFTDVDTPEALEAVLERVGGFDRRLSR